MKNIDIVDYNLYLSEKYCSILFELEHVKDLDLESAMLIKGTGCLILKPDPMLVGGYQIPWEVRITTMSKETIQAFEQHNHFRIGQLDAEGEISDAFEFTAVGGDNG
ncbi:MAG: hypothetical protein AB3N14_04600 [Flavobacteriaceae bacterium]